MNKKEYLKKKQKRNEDIDILINNLKTEDIHFNLFIDKLKNNGFFSSINNNYLLEIKDNPSFLNLNKNNITISIEKNENILIGIDPSKYFDKINRCSIIIKFPMKKRSYNMFEIFFDKLLDEKSDLHKEWIKNARYSWNGEFANF